METCEASNTLWSEIAAMKDAKFGFCGVKDQLSVHIRADLQTNLVFEESSIN